MNRNSGISTVLVLIIVAVLAVAGYAYNSSNKRKELDAAMGQLNQQARLWDDAMQVAAATSRIALPTQINNLQAIKRSVDALPMPQCLKNTQQTLSAGMEATIQAYVSFMANTNGNGESEAAIEFQRAKSYMDKFKTVKAQC